MMEANGVNPSDFSDEYIVRAIDMVKSRANFVNDLWEQGKFFFTAPKEYAEKDIRKRWKADTPSQMEELTEVLASLPDFSSQAAEPVVLGWITDKGYHMGNVMNAFRLAVVGECKRPPHVRHQRTDGTRRDNPPHKRCGNTHQARRRVKHSAHRLEPAL